MLIQNLEKKETKKSFNYSEIAFLDCEWLLKGDLLFVGVYTTNSGWKKFLPSDSNSLNKFIKNYSLVVVYGNDAGVIKKNMDVDLKKNFNCLNYIRIINKYTRFKTKRIYDLENKLGLKREVKLYKHSIQRLFDDWKRPERREAIYKYNREDCKNLYHIFKIIQSQIKLSFQDYLKECMK